MELVKTISSDIVSGWRWLKFFRKGPQDVQTAWVASPPGTDAAPIKDMVAVYGGTSAQGKPVIIGYVNVNQLAGSGDHRTFSQDSNGAVKFYIWQKADGTCEIGGADDFMVRYTKMAESFQELQDSVNDLKTIIGTWVVAPGDGGSALKAVLAAWLGTPLVKDITQSKITEIKTIGFTP